jgi:enterochelin esterase family protein
MFVAQPVFAQRGGPALRSPEVLPDARVTFRIAAPNATDVRVSGDFLKAPEALNKDEKGVWSVTIGPVSPEIYNYQLSVNGLVTTRGRLDVPAASPRFYDVRPVAHGAVEQRLYDSKTVPGVRRVFIYTRPSGTRFSTCFMVPAAMRAVGPRMDAPT